MKCIQLSKIVKSLLSEAKDYDIKSFKDLPKYARYGFIVWPDLTISVINTEQGHGQHIWKSVTSNPKLIAPDYVSGEDEYKGKNIYEILYDKGLLEMVIEQDQYNDSVMWIRGKGTPKTIKLAKDIASMYNLEYFIDK